jgi:hypothetical protein
LFDSFADNSIVDGLSMSRNRIRYLGCEQVAIVEGDFELNGETWPRLRNISLSKPLLHRTATVGEAERKE